MTNLTPAELVRLGLDPKLLAEAENLGSHDLSEWFDADGTDEAYRVYSFCVLEQDQYEDAFSIRPATGAAEVVAAFTHAAEFLESFGGTDEFEDVLAGVVPQVADAWYRRLREISDALGYMSHLAEKRASGGRKSR